jgi:hypothetical protein
LKALILLTPSGHKQTIILDTCTVALGHNVESSLKVSFTRLAVNLLEIFWL